MRESEKTLKMSNNLKKKALKKFAIDSSAKFYPVISSKKSQSLFCVGAVLKDEIDPSKLKSAINDVVRRFPTFAVSVEKGYGWHYLQENLAEVELFEAEERILRPIDTKVTNGYMFRISYIKNRIRIDMFHGLCDGTASILFLKSIILRYRQLCGAIIGNSGNIALVKDESTAAEVEDSYLKYYSNMKLHDMDIKTLKGGVPLRLLGEPIGETGYFNVEGTASLNDVKVRAKAFNVTLSAYICGVLAMTIESMSKENKPIVIMVPVNLRKVFPSESMRNFVTFVRLVIKRGKNKTLEEFCLDASVQLKEKSSKEKLQHFICTTVKVQNNGIVSAIPLAIKSLLINVGRDILKARQTVIYSNVGLMDAPEELGIDKFTINMNVSRFNPQNMGSITIGDKISFNFTRTIKESTLSDAFFSKMEELGIAIDTECEGVKAD